jgi:hypothetical protein
MIFEAPMSAVALLLRKGLVVPAPAEKVLMAPRLIPIQDVAERATKRTGAPVTIDQDRDLHGIAPVEQVFAKSEPTPLEDDAAGVEPVIDSPASDAVPLEDARPDKRRRRRDR